MNKLEQSILSHFFTLAEADETMGNLAPVGGSRCLMHSSDFAWRRCLSYSLPPIFFFRSVLTGLTPKVWAHKGCSPHKDDKTVVWLQRLGVCIKPQTCQRGVGLTSV